MFDFIQKIRGKAESIKKDKASSKGVSRAQFLRGDISGRKRPFRPPWALDEYEFTETCTRCGDCIKACAEGILVEGRGRFPVVEFVRGECTFCEACVADCKPQALRFESEDELGEPWQLDIRLGHTCVIQKGVVCQVCGEQCMENVFRFRPQLGGMVQIELETEKCTGCGACIAPCPVNALSLHHGGGDEGEKSVSGE